MTPADYKADILRHCLWMASIDPQYAHHAAGWYEKNDPELLKNLQAKVWQEIHRFASTSRSAPEPGSTTAPTGVQRQRA